MKKEKVLIGLSKTKENLFKRCQGSCSICFNEGGCSLEKLIKRFGINNVKKVAYNEKL